MGGTRRWANRARPPWSIRPKESRVRGRSVSRSADRPHGAELPSTVNDTCDEGIGDPQEHDQQGHRLQDRRKREALAYFGGERFDELSRGQNLEAIPLTDSARNGCPD